MRLIHESYHQPTQGRFKDAFVQDGANSRLYAYDSQGSYAIIDQTGKTVPQLSISGNQITIAGGNTITLPTSTGGVITVNGQTGIVTLTKTDLGLGNVDNTSDASKPVSSATATALAGKQATLVSGTTLKTINGATLLGAGDITITGGGGTVSDATTTTKGVVQLAGDLGGTAAAPTVPVLRSGQNGQLLRYNNGAPSWDYFSNVATEATTTARGVLKLAGDLAGTADAPTVPALANLTGATIYGDGTDKTAAINAMLVANAGKRVNLLGNITISAPLRIPSDTTLFARGATITLAAGSHCNAVQNFAVQASRRARDGVTNASTKVLTSQMAAFVSGDVGKAIRIYFNDGSYLDTTIATYTSATSVTLTAQPAFGQNGLVFSIGTRDRNITVTGGRWVREADNLAPSGSQGYESNHFRFRHATNVSVQDIVINHVSGKYSVNLGDVTGFTVLNVVAEQTHSDVVHINGPASHGVIQGIRSQGSTDDLVSLTGGDFGLQMENMADTMGDITDITVRSVNGRTGNDGVFGTRAVLLLGGQGTTGNKFLIDRIYVNDIDTRLQAGAVMIGNDTQDTYTTSGRWGRIVIENVINRSLTGTNPNYAVRVDDSAAVTFLAIKDVLDAGNADVYIQGGGASVGTLIVDGVDPSRVVIDGVVTTYYNYLAAAFKNVVNTFTRTQTFTDTGGSEGLRSNHLRVYPKSTGGSASIFEDNNNGQVWEFFNNNGGSWGLYDGTNGKQPLTIDPNTTVALKMSGTVAQFSGGGINVAGDSNLNGKSLNNVNVMNPSANGSGSVGLSGYAYLEAYINKVHLSADPTAALDAATKQYVDSRVVSSGSGITRQINAITANTSGGTTASTDYIYYWSGSTTYTFTLPTAVGNTSVYELKNGGTVPQTVNTTSSQTIDGSSTITIKAGDAYRIFSDNTNWRAM